MAIIIPANPNNETPYSERTLFNAFQNQLSDDYLIYHGLNWLGSQGNRRLQGETDFLICHPQKGIMIVEVKGGQIERKGGIWYQHHPDGTFDVIEPEEQNKFAKFEIEKLLSSKRGTRHGCLLGSCIWFTGGTIIGDLSGIEDDPEIIFDASNMHDVEGAFDKAYKRWALHIRKKLNWNHSFYFNHDDIHNIFHPPFRIVPSMRMESGERKGKLDFVELHREQAIILDYLEEVSRVAIHGSAGTGKSMLANEMVKRLTEKREEVLLLCYNTALEADLKYHHYNNKLAKVCGFGEWARDTIDPEMKMRKDYPDPDDYYNAVYEKFLDYLVENHSDNKFRNIIIDEGQDFRNDWLEILEMITEGDGYFYVFYDRDQKVHHYRLAEWFTKVPTRLTLSRNCRNTAEIAFTSYKPPQLKFRHYENMVNGQKPVIYEYKSDLDMQNKLNSLVMKLVDKKKYEPNDISVLTFKKLGNGALPGTNELKTIGKQPYFTKINYDYEKQEKSRGEGVFYNNVRRFKGLEADCVILVDVIPEELKDDIKKELFYVGATRARKELYIFMKQSDEETYKDLFENMEIEEKLSADVHGFAEWVKADVEKN